MSEASDRIQARIDAGRQSLDPRDAVAAEQLNDLLTVIKEGSGAAIDTTNFATKQDLAGVVSDIGTELAKKADKP